MYGYLPMRSVQFVSDAAKLHDLPSAAVTKRFFIAMALTTQSATLVTAESWR
ncbi:hypothetical protein ALQ43_102667 [Pseudomonas savastanoi pv. glycinea]|uniref:Uncharacterized protein n=1 Tax=Pseudomonas savastanoi pv. glycinea TaxID=318 RepID=A0A3M3GDB0_PSESG|nr:hypothetical protein ALQ73_102141 [Pseudomonas savastanoi pv. glycinea]RMO41011.1 hypothetical protein ALQ43_102667 [Pseudomonas savastanoi pv. glycinea]RMT13431.1 hypothetical protein ALP53_102430 [Pseudomonas savastanoi pv. phaseolicola]RMU03976.1 hypothetical protein ALP37_03338 [Pseudomonas amygdali pv. sesami]